eukprot:1150104-Pelagomonas_calceolata.AAC.5
MSRLLRKGCVETPATSMKQCRDHTTLRKSGKSPFFLGNSTLLVHRTMAVRQAMCVEDAL